ncbi:MAG TPA: glycosyltransferase 87 family protein [Mycobacteriales bacterium]|nr:glycosyltransferase 87 family protein [Mycobacteriales bacterium]
MSSGPTPIAPSQEDPVVGGVSRLIGGRWGDHTTGGTWSWWTPLRVALMATLLVTLCGYLQKSPCLTHSYSNDYQYTRLCYTDTFALYGVEGLNARVNSAGEVTGRVSVPYRDHPVEYPPVIGGLMWLAAEATVLVHPGEAADRATAHNTTFFNLTALGLAAAALISTFTVAKLAGRRREWDAMLVALSPVLFMHAFTNWDLVAVALTGLGLWAWSRGSPGWAGLALGVGIATKLYPVFVLLALVMLCARAGKWRAAGKSVATAVAGVVACYLPAILISRSFPFPDASCPDAHPLPGWRWFLSLSQTRGADWGSIWLVFQHLFGGDRVGRALSAQPACGAAPTTLNIVSSALVLAVVVAVGALVAIAPRRPRVAQVAFLLVAGFIVFNKVDSPQYALWLLPLAVLARPRWAALLTWQVSEVVLGAMNLLTLIALDHSDQGVSLSLYLGFVLARDVILFVVMALVVREVLVPHHDVVRRDGVDDPAGGVLDHAPDPGTGRRDLWTSAAGTAARA